jgi:hypothetical protein
MAKKTKIQSVIYWSTSSGNKVCGIYQTEQELKEGLDSLLEKGETVLVVFDLVNPRVIKTKRIQVCEPLDSEKIDWDNFDFEDEEDEEDE